VLWIVSDVRGRIVVVTGAGAGIGREIALRFGAHGATVVGLEIDADRVATLEHDLGRRGATAALIMRGDATASADVDALMDEVANRFGHVDVLVNNVGEAAGGRADFGDTDEAAWDELYRLNLRHTFLVTRAALPQLRASGTGASIINLSSIEAFRAAPLLAVYASFKAAITGFTRSLAVELGPEGIRVNAIAPETTETEQVPVSEWVPRQYRERIRDWIPLGRFGRPEDVAECALFLGSSASAWITGTTLHVDGARWLRAGTSGRRMVAGHIRRWSSTTATAGLLPEKPRMPAGCETPSDRLPT
jgi:NAD(P)-dependent dehydrogenase (short-subunit alcohol dehydrogenase family)